MDTSCMYLSGGNLNMIYPPFLVAKRAQKSNRVYSILYGEKRSKVDPRIPIPIIKDVLTSRRTPSDPPRSMYSKSTQALLEHQNIYPYDQSD